MEANDTARLAVAHEQLKERLPAESIVADYEPDAIARADQIIDQILQGENSELKQTITSAHQVFSLLIIWHTATTTTSTRFHVQ